MYPTSNNHLGSLCEESLSQMNTLACNLARESVLLEPEGTQPLKLAVSSPFLICPSPKSLSESPSFIPYAHILNHKQICRVAIHRATPSLRSITSQYLCLK